MLINYTSKYATAWAVLKKHKILVLTLDTPRVERTVRKAIIEHKKLDKDKNPLERIKTTKALVDGKITLTFRLIHSIRHRTEFLDLIDSTDLTTEDPYDVDL